MRATRCDRYRCAQNADHFAHNSPFSAFFAEVVCTLGTTPPRTVISPPPEGGLHYSRLRHVGDTPSASSSYHKDPSPPTWRPLHSGLIPTPQAWRTPQDRQAWLRCPWAGPGRASHSDTSSAGVEGAGGSGGPWQTSSRRTNPHQPPGRKARGLGCGARGRWRGLAGLRDDAPSEARSADGSRAGHRPRAHQAARPSKAHQPAPGTPAAPSLRP